MPLSLEEKRKRQREYARKKRATPSLEQKERNKRYCKEYRQRYREERLLKDREYYYKRREKILEYKKEYREKNKEKQNLYLIEWRKQNKEKVKEYNKKARASGKYKHCDIIKGERKRKAFINKATEPEIIQIYQNCPKDHQVDHIIPIKNKNVCGLHTPCNLQYLPTKENNFKRNSFDGTYNNLGWKKRFNKL